MEYRKFQNKIIVRMDKGEEILEKVREVAEKKRLNWQISVHWELSVNLQWALFDTEAKEYHANEFKGSFEIVSLTGTINTMNDEFYCHLHMSAGNEKGQVFGGHLNRAIISATCEMIITLIDGRVDRRFEKEVGLNLFQFQ